MTTTVEKTVAISREDFLKIGAVLKLEGCKIAEGKIIYVREMTGTERDAFEASIVTMRGKNHDVNLKGARAKLLVKTLANEAGSRMFKDGEENLVGALGADLVDKLFTVAQKVNGMSEKDVKELIGDLGVAQSGASISD